MSLTRFEHPIVHPQDDLYMQFYVFLSCIHISSLVDGRMCLILSIKHILLCKLLSTY